MSKQAAATLKVWGYVSYNGVFTGSYASPYTTITVPSQTIIELIANGNTLSSTTMYVGKIL